MDWKKYDRLPNGDHVRKEINEEGTLTVDNYDGSKIITDEKTWSVSEFVDSTLLCRSGLIARCMLTGKTEKGKDDLNNPNPVSTQMRIKIKVLSRQGCHLDADGNEINTRPKELELCVKPTDKPLPGDKVVVRDGMKVLNKLSKPYEGAERNRDIMMGKSINLESVYTVDEDCCINVTIKDAFTLLGKAGKRLVMPEFKPAISNLNRDDRKLERRISNWLYQEVPQDFVSKETKVKKEKQAKQEAADKKLLKEQEAKIKELQQMLEEQTEPAKETKETKSK